MDPHMQTQEFFIFNYSWFIPFAHYIVSKHKHFPNIATKAGCPSTGMEQKKNWAWKLNHSE